MLDYKIEAPETEKKIFSLDSNTYLNWFNKMDSSFQLFSDVINETNKIVARYINALCN